MFIDEEAALNRAVTTRLRRIGTARPASLFLPLVVDAYEMQGHTAEDIRRTDKAMLGLLTLEHLTNEIWLFEVDYHVFPYLLRR